MKKKCVSLHRKMDDSEVYFVDVLLPLHLPGTYTYRVPRELNGQVRPGVRVVVQFGQKTGRMYSAIVRRIHNKPPQWKSKYILGVLDSEPLVSERQMQLWEWMARYYMCHLGDVMQIALPAGLKLASESAISIHPSFDGELSRLTRYERMVVDLLSQHPVMRVEDISRAIGVQKIMPLIRTMIEREVVVMEEELRERFVPRKSTYLHLSETYSDEKKLKELFDELERKKRTKQIELLMQFLQLSHFGKELVAKRMLSNGSAMQTLIKNGVLATEERVESRLVGSGLNVEAVENIKLNDEQENARKILADPNSPEVCLLHGVTSSGKTEVYIKLIDEQVRAGHQVLMLLPEIALTAQIINRLRRYFGDKVGVYHSRFSTSQRVEVWQRTAIHEPDNPARYQVLLGARSAIFLPFNDLSLVIVDEEHDSSYKQYDPAPRYQGRDTAIYLAHMWGARTILGSATPSVETYHNALNGKYGLAVMRQRYGGFKLPEVKCVDMKQARLGKQLKGHFSQELLDAIRHALVL